MHTRQEPSAQGDLSHPQPSNQPRITLADIAAMTGYSVATVSKALNGGKDISQTARQRIQATLHEQGYNKRRRAVDSRQAIEIVFATFDNLWSLEVLRGVLREARQHGLSVITTESGDRLHPDTNWIEGVVRRKPLGVILVFSDLTGEERSRLAACHIPYVTLDPAGDPAPDMYSVQADNWTGGVIATRHLLSLGHTRIGIITGPLEMMCSKARLDGYRSALDERGIPYDAALVREGDFTTKRGYAQSVSLITQSKPTAIFAGNDLQAMGAYEAARTMDLKIPSDLSIVGFDDLQMSGFMGPALTTVRQPLFEMSKAATRMVLALRENTSIAPHTVFPTSLVTRSSTMPWRQPLQISSIQ